MSIHWWAEPRSDHLVWCGDALRIRLYTFRRSGIIFPDGTGVLRMHQSRSSLREQAASMRHEAWSMRHEAWSMKHAAWSMKHEAWGLRLAAWLLTMAVGKSNLLLAWINGICTIFVEYENCPVCTTDCRRTLPDHPGVVEGTAETSLQSLHLPTFSASDTITHGWINRTECFPFRVRNQRESGFFI